MMLLRSTAFRHTLVNIDELPAFCRTATGGDPATIFIEMNHRIIFPWRRPSVSTMVDHPCSLMKELAAPLSTDAITGWVDATHLPALKALGFSHRSVFLPHAGPRAAMHTVPFDEREIDIFFAGNLAEPAARPKSETAPSNDAPSAIDLLYDTIEELEKTGAPVLPALLEILKRRGVSSSDMTRDIFAEVITRQGPSEKARS